MASIRKRTYKGSTYYQVRGVGLETKSFARKRDAETYADHADRRRKLGTLYDAAPETLGEALEKYFDVKAATKWKASTLKTNLSIRRNLDPLADVLLTDLTRARVATFLASMAKTGRRREAQKCQALIVATLRDAQANGQRVDQGVYGIDRVTVKSRQPVALTVEQLDRLASCVVPTYLRAIVPVAGLTGIRRGELLALREDDLDLPNGYLTVLDSKTDSGRRRVYLTPALVVLLRDHLIGRPPTGTAYVFPTPTGLAWDGSRFFSRVFAPARDWAATEDPKLADVTFHDLRHTAISLMAREGVPVGIIADQVGHADGGALLLKRYRHEYAGERAAQMARFGAAVAPAKKRGTKAGQRKTA